MTSKRRIYIVDHNTRTITWGDPLLPPTVYADAPQYQCDYRRGIVYFRSQPAMRLIADAKCDVHVRLVVLRGQLRGDHASPTRGSPQAAHSQD